MILKIHSSKIVTWFCSQRDLFLENITRIHLLLHFHFLWSSFTRNLNFGYMFMGEKMVFIHMWQVHVKMLSHYVGKSYVTSEAKPWLDLPLFTTIPISVFLVCFIGLENILVIFDQKLLFATQPKSIYWKSSCSISTDSLGIETLGCCWEI